ncbi:electron transfer flavoprotein-ubiquinone oxidoreductase [Methylobacterium sp. WL30]|uniref:electron transfer flavoprotein-ubiquinone oxidoreductase n=1 Tax=unclassified Methylobacterium TaxID=2615210 RepID=UPI0011CB84CF|nr:MULTISPECIES: electron transfer flavoprotein-ubiquinone oxidoreductase [unclassified Methylobacterium]TXM94877.1 electron transfer flavoprotein-ubiquinone oxidoreductase [Methylobacterium sp. WL116]TXN39749.1 electron transfer flavoprotein-ubiquinone oxidoreductase [Methylobacterium sp. WL93]TXN52956.1 electron transfer flavoprotein-ubiquinone oxidoreductase [Methylobacterium sp. WL119]TXN66551.1 electron transfer flavoprotein-ubiquinone oxidoreductase [Methylobacterium sp. WL30]TXN72781.1 
MAHPEREGMDFDVVVVGAGPAGLAAAIRLKQHALESGDEVNVVVVEKGSEVGAHILSGAVIDPSGLDVLVPDWRDDPERPLKTAVERDEFLFLTKNSGVTLPNLFFPKFMSNHGNFVGSLSNVTKYLGAKAEALGVEIYPGFPASEVLYDDRGVVVGVATGDLGIAKSGEPRDDYTRGMELRGKYVIFGEGARGSLTKTVIDRFQLNRHSDHQKYGLGVKELWQLAPGKFEPGLVRHSMGWPLPNKAGGGSWLYHFDDHLLSVGFVTHLNYENPTLSPFEEFQRFKTHPMIREVFEGAKRIGYGARAIMEGGWQSVPKLVFPGGCLVGDSAGFVNVPRIKGSHNAVLSGMQAADAIAAALKAGRQGDELTAYDAGWRDSAIGTDLKAVRNVKPLWSRYGTLAGVGLGGLDMWSNTLLNASIFGTLKHGKPDHACTKPISEVTPIVYPKPDGKLTFDRLSSVYLSNTNHEEDQPAHLQVKDMGLQKTSEHDVFGGPSARYCPAGVYEWVEDAAAGDGVRYQINAQNCVHCKTCDIKDPNQNINWVTPEGPGGPNYPNM